MELTPEEYRDKLFEIRDSALDPFKELLDRSSEYSLTDLQRIFAERIAMHPPDRTWPIIACLREETYGDLVEAANAELYDACSSGDYTESRLETFRERAIAIVAASVQLLDG